MRHHLARTIALRAPIALLLVAISGHGLDAQAATQAADAVAAQAASDDRGGRLYTRTGVSVVDVVELDGDYYEPSFGVVPTFGVGWSWRVATFDFGLQVDHLPGKKSPRQAGPSVHLGDQVMAAGVIRWRFVDRPWGGFFLLVSPGLALSETTESFRDAIADRQAVAPGDIDQTAVGFTYAAEIGFLAVLADGLVFQMALASVGTHGTLTVGDESQSYERYRGLVRAGLEWHL